MSYIVICFYFVFFIHFLQAWYTEQEKSISERMDSMRGHKTKLDETKELLKRHSKRPDISEEHRTAILGTLAFFEEEKKTYAAEWKTFLRRMKTLQKEWDSRLTAEEFQFEVSTYDQPSFRTFRLHLNKKGFSTWIFSVEVHPENQNETYFSAVIGPSERKVTSFEEVEMLINDFFEKGRLGKMIKDINRSVS